MALIDKLTAIGNAIREKTGTTALIPLADMPQAILNIAGGGASEGNYKEAFNALANGSFMGSNIARIDFYITNPFTSHNNFFRNTSKLKYVKGINMSNSTAIRFMFSGSAIETIEEPLDFSKVKDTTNGFACDYLIEVRFVPGTIKTSIKFSRCSTLSAQSVQSIIDGLATVTTAQTLTINKAITLTDAQKASITAKGWTLAQ